MSAELREKYRAKGWAIFPLAPATKEPRRGLKWSQDFDGDWGPDENVAVALGDRSGGLVDIDLDWPESAVLGAALFENRSASFGRQSSPRSHYLFRSKLNTQKFKLPKTFLSKNVPDEHSLKGLVARAIRFDLPPGYMGGKHYHPGDVFVYVQKGSFLVKVKGETRTIEAGMVYRESPNVPMRAGNGSTAEETTIIVFQVGAAGQPVMVKAE